jgi:hypothetical protein
MAEETKKRICRVSFMAMLVLPALLTPLASADPLTEPAFYNGQLVHFLLPSANSSDPNKQIVADCFRVGPRPPAEVPVNAKAYILMIPGADQETTCSTDARPAGDLTHNHVFSAAPGNTDYNGKFKLVVIHPGPNYPGPECWPAS